MDDWMDEQFKLGYEIRDQVARDKAKEIAREMGFTEERFKASAKWLDKVSGMRACVRAWYRPTHLSHTSLSFFSSRSVVERTAFELA